MAAPERLKPANRAEWLNLRKNDVTASQIGALVGAHPYCTAYQLWAEKTGKIVPDHDLDSPAMRRGRLLEKVGVELAAEALPEAELHHNSGTPDYYRLPDVRIGATPDLLAHDARGPGVIQLKSINPWIYKQTWIDHEPPLWIALQALTEAKLTGAEWAMVGALRVDNGCDFNLTNIPLHAAAWQALVDASGEFWRSVQADTPPQPDYARDHETIRAMYMISAPDTSIDLSGDNELITALHEREEIMKLSKQMDDQKQQFDALIRHKVGEHETALAGPFRITFKTQEVAGYTVKPRIQRSLRIKEIRREA